MIASALGRLAQGNVVIPDFGGGGGSGPSCAAQNKFFCWDWFSGHWSDVFEPALLQHIKLTLIAVAIGFVIAFIAGLIAFRFGWFETIFSGFSQFLFTIPSLALFFILVPITGLTVLSAEIALVSYTLLIIFRNVVVGLRDVPPDVLESARGMGLNPTQMLFRVQLPLALPAIIAGLRVATVTVVSLATVAAFVVDEGLGSPILKALQNTFTTEIVGAGGLAFLLALAGDGLLVLVQHVLTPWTRARQA